MWLNIYTNCEHIKMLWITTPFILMTFFGNVTEAGDMAFAPLTRQFLRKIDSNSSYNRYSTPTQYDEYIRLHGPGKTTNVSISMYIEGISSFRAQTMDFQLDMYFQQDWMDHRLAHNGSAPILIKDRAIFNQMWHPDVYFANARSASFQHITDENFLVWVYPNGRVWYDCRISASIMCDMNLWKFPLDSQECNMRILSYAYPESQLRLLWTERDEVPPIDVNPDIQMPDMHLIAVEKGLCNGTYATGVWSCMTAIFRVERQKMHHVTQTYVPTGLIVVISWFNFWLDVDSAPARVSLSITTLLTIATQANAVKLALPEVSYMKAFVFGVMIEFTICHFAKNQELNRKDKPNIIVDSALSLFGPATRDIDELNDDDLGMGVLTKAKENHIALNMLNGDNGRRESKNREFEKNGVGYYADDKIRRIRNKPSFNRLRQQFKTISASRRALSWTRTLKNLRGRRVAQRIDERSRIVFPTMFIIFNLVYWNFYLVFN